MLIQFRVTAECYRSRSPSTCHQRRNPSAMSSLKIDYEVLARFTDVVTASQVNAARAGCTVDALDTWAEYPSEQLSMFLQHVFRSGVAPARLLETKQCSYRGPHHIFMTSSCRCCAMNPFSPAPNLCSRRLSFFPEVYFEDGNLTM